MADRFTPDDNDNLYSVDMPDVEGADEGWDDWGDEFDESEEQSAEGFAMEEDDVPDVAAPTAISAEDPVDDVDVSSAEADTSPAAPDAEAIYAESAPETPAEPTAEAVSADAPASYEVEEVEVEDAEWDDWDDTADFEDDFDEAEVSDEQPSEQPAAAAATAEPEAASHPAAELDADIEEIEEIADIEEIVDVDEPDVAPAPEADAEAEAQDAAEDAVEPIEAPEKTEEELQREQEELEAYREAMGDSNAEMADISEYRNFRKKTKTEPKSSKPKKSDFDLFANRYKVKTMNAMVAASDPIVYFYNACLRPDGSIMAFNVYQVLQDRFLGKMIPQLFTAVAENSNKIEDLNEANLLEQIKVCAEFPQYDFIISVSARFFIKPALLERFLKLLPEGGVPNLVLAFDCSSLENIAIAAKAGLGTIRQKGVKILLDNTERVTMTVLSEFDYDIIRIDSRYYEMGNPRAEAYLRLLLQLTKESGITSIATFCDSEDLADYMFFMGVEAVQGNATSRPMRTVPNAVKSITLLPSMMDA